METGLWWSEHKRVTSFTPDFRIPQAKIASGNKEIYDQQWVAGAHGSEHMGTAGICEKGRQKSEGELCLCDSGD